MPNGYLIDSDILRLYRDGHSATATRVQANVSNVYLSTVTLEEAIAGRLNLIKRAQSSKGGITLPDAHAGFADLIADVRLFPVFIYSEEAEAVFRTFPPRILRVGPQDCRLAAQAMAHGMTVITRNLRDFQAIGAPCEDWSA